MKFRSGLALCCLVVLGACAPHPRESSGSARPALGLGIDKQHMDPDVRPQDDLYRFVNGSWLEATEIPADKAETGSFTELGDRAEADLRAIIEEMASTDLPHGGEEQKVGDFHRAYMNTELIARKGRYPLDAEMQRIDAISDRGALIRYLGHRQRFAFADPFGLSIQPDLRDSSRYLIYVWQSGLGLPDRDYYFDEGFSELRREYVEYIADLLSLAGLPDADEKAATIMALETRLAQAHWDKVRNRDPHETYNLYTIAGANALTPGFDWGAFLRPSGIEGERELILSQPSYVEAATSALADEAIDTWKTYLAYKLLDDAAPYLTGDYVQLNFEFHGRTLSGAEEIRPRWKRAVEDADIMLGEALGKVYVERHFPPEAGARMDAMIENLRKAFELSIEKLAWMGPETRAQAQEKLRKFTPKIGHPSRWRDYTSLAIRPDDLYGNIQRSLEFEFRRNVDKLGGPIDETEWFMTPQTVNAYYDATMNEIVFPAAILRPPFFDVDADDAANYGGIGAVIGHEFSHGFDDEGRKFDGDGNLRDWWVEADDERFQARAARLGEQYDGYHPIDDMHVNGAFTMGENIGDLAGVTMAHRAYRLSLGGREAPVIDGFSGDQRFVMGWAQVWRTLCREDEMRRRLMVDPHSPGEYRANGTLINIDAFHEAFATRPGDGMWKAPDQRVRIW
jgi:predicted metalloendopeptidase